MPAFNLTTPFGHPGFDDARVSVTQRNGAWYIRSRQTLKSFPKRLTDRLEEGAEKHPDRWLVAQRNEQGDWTGISYGQMRERARCIGQALVDRMLSARRPIAILSGNDLEHLQLALGAMLAGIPHAPISPAYSLASGDHRRLRRTLEQLNPGLVYAADGEAFASPLARAVPAGAEIVTRTGSGPVTSTAFPELLATPPSSIVGIGSRQGADTIVKFLLTSGSTGIPKAVPTTNLMLCSNQQMLLEAFPDFGEAPPVLVDWLPWSHTYGGSHNVGVALYNGGTLYIDDGKPVADHFDRTVRNLREIAPTVHFNVPRGWEILTAHLERDPVLRSTFFSRVSVLFFAGAALSPDTLMRLERLSEGHCGERVRIAGGLGMTETSPASLVASGPAMRPGYVGLPIAACELKLAPRDGRLEARYRGPHVMQRYWPRADAQADESFDEEGFFCSGDALTFLDPDRPELGLMFDGRIAEDFKLSSGTFVRVGPMRARLQSLGAPYVMDAVLTGSNEREIGALIFPSLNDCRRLAGLDDDASPGEVLASRAVRAFFRDLLRRFNSAATGSASTISCLRLLAAPPSLDAGELTDKGSINQRAVRVHRAKEVTAMHDARRPDASVIYAEDSDRAALPGQAD